MNAKNRPRLSCANFVNARFGHTGFRPRRLPIMMIERSRRLRDIQWQVCAQTPAGFEIIIAAYKISVVTPCVSKFTRKLI